MKKTVFIAIFFLSFSVLFAQSVLFKTGDAVFDGYLGELNVSAKLSGDTFIAGVSVDFKISKDQVQVAVSAGMEPAEVYLAAGFAVIAKQPVKKIVDLWKKNKGKGWGVVAKTLNIKPGSKSFKDLKEKVKVKKDKVKGKGR